MVEGRFLGREDRESEGKKGGLQVLLILLRDKFVPGGPGVLGFCLAT